MVNKVEDSELFQGIFESSVEGILVVDDQGNIIKANPSAEKMFAYQSGELFYTKIENLIPDQFRNNHKNHRTEYANMPKSRSMGKGRDLWGLKKNGTQFPLEISLSPTTIKGTKVVIAFIIDITVRLAADKKAAVNLDRMDEAQSLAHVGSWFWNLQSNEMSWSDEFYRICGLSPGDERLNPKTLNQFILQDDGESPVSAVNYAIENNIPYNHEKKIVRVDGTVRHIMAKGKATYDTNGRPLQWFGTIQDITEQKETELQLEDNLVKNKALLDALPDMMFILNHEGQFLECYAPEPDKLFVQPTAIIGRKINEVLPKHVFEAIREGMDKTIDSNEMQLVEYDFEAKEGRQFYEGRIVPMNKHRLLTIIRDITAEKAIENILYIRNRALASTASGIVICDAQKSDFPIIYGNKAFSKITGYDRADFIGKNCRFLQGTDRNQNDIKVMAVALKKGKACRVVLRNYRKDGSLFWNEVSITPIYNDKRVLTHFVGEQNDVTARKVEEFFKIGQSHVMEMIIQYEPLEHIADKIIETIETAIPNCMGSILLLNKEEGTLNKLAATNLPQNFVNVIEGLSIGSKKGSCGTAAYLKEEVIVTDISKDPLWEDYKEIALANNLKACWSFPIFSSNRELLGTFAIYFNTSRKPLETEKEIVFNITQATSVAIEQHTIGKALQKSKEELAKYAEVLENKVAERTTELKDMVQKLVESNLSLEDQIQITKAAENSALTSQELMTAIFKNFPRGFVAVVNLDLQVVLIEGEELEELGFSGLADMGIKVNEVKGVAPDVLEKVIYNITKTLQGEHCSFEMKVQNRSYLVNTTPLYDKNKNITQALIVHNNISDQKRVEVEIRNTLHKEKEINELKSRFISMASHEFRTPLSAILSATNLIERQNAADQEDKRIKYIDSIKSSIKNLVAVLNDFLSLSKLEEGKVIAQPSLFDFVEFSKSLVEEVEGIKKKGQEINIVNDQSRIPVHLDPKLLRHIVHNLLVNAIKYSQENKIIIFKIDCDDTKLSITVVDEGIGIPEEDQFYLFQRFYRAKNATNFQGTGLGLNIVRQYTELMDGAISFQSKLNEGTKFTVELPLNLVKNEKTTAY